MLDLNKGYFIIYLTKTYRNVISIRSLFDIEFSFKYISINSMLDLCALYFTQQNQTKTQPNKKFKTNKFKDVEYLPNII